MQRRLSNWEHLHSVPRPQPQNMATPTTHQHEHGMTLRGVASDTRVQVAQMVVLPVVSSWAVIPPCGCRSGPGREQSTKAELQSSPGTPGLLTWIPGQRAPCRDIAHGPQSSLQQKHLLSVSQVENWACQGSLAPGFCSLMWRSEPDPLVGASDLSCRGLAGPS